MLGQGSFSDLEYANKKRRARRELFLAEMDAVVPWPELLAVVKPHYPRAGGGGGPRAGGGRGAGSSAGRVGRDAADLLSSAMVCPVGPPDGGRALRHREPAPVCRFFQCP